MYNYKETEIRAFLAQIYYTLTKGVDLPINQLAACIFLVIEFQMIVILVMVLMVEFF